VIVRANASGGNQQMNRSSQGNNGGGRLSLKFGRQSRRRTQGGAGRRKNCSTRPGVADSRLGRDDGRPELAVQVDRAKAALLGVSATTVANTIRTNIAGTQAALFRQGGQEYPIIVRLREDQRQVVGDVSDVLVSTPTGQVLQAKNLMRVEDAVGPPDSAGSDGLRT
jgi:HAE1 family hydrophobic/amphiphilic exporter-1